MSGPGPAGYCPRCRLVRGGLCAVLSWSAAVAQQVTFNPQVSLGHAYTDNVQYVGDDGADGSDSSTRLGVNLPMTRATRGGSWTLGYAAAYTKYREFSEADNDEHRLGFSLDTRPSRRSTLGFSAGYTLTQEQANPLLDDDTGLFLGQRTQRQTIGSSLSFSREVARRWQWTGSVGAARSTFDAVETFDTPDPLLAAEDRTSYQGSLGFRHTISKKTSIAATYAYQRYDLAERADENVQLIDGSLLRDVNRRLAVGLRLGAYSRSRDADGVATEDFDEDGVIVGLDVNFNEGLELGPVRFDFDAGISPSSGGALGGTSTNSTVAASVSGVRAEPWNWGVTARYTRRDPSDDDLPTLSIASLGGLVERRLGKQVGLRLGAHWGDQTSSDNASVEGSFYAAGLDLVWYPLAGRRISGGGGGQP